MARPAARVLLPLLLTLLCGCSAHSGDAPPRRNLVHVAAAVTGPATPAVLTTGAIANKDEARLSFKVPGVIRAIYVEQGATVHAGQKLAQIDLGEIDAQVAQVRALAEKAERDQARGERLYADEVISLEQLQDLRTQNATAKAQLQAIEFNRGYAIITAPGDGVVLRKLVQERELVQAGAPVLVIGTRGRGFVARAALADRELVQLKLGDPAELRLDAYPGKVLSGELTEIAGAADERTGLFPIEVRVEDPPAGLASGMVTKLRLSAAAGRASTLTYVPLAAIIEGSGDAASVFVLDHDRARRRDVKVAFIDPAGVALAGGVRPGERVVTDGALYLEDNDPVEIATDSARVPADSHVAAR
ncbi:MAG: efflux RND transporter periplasmic adaptor subunit [Proteobacteria bacterium]|nr:efflux RND transporter periplasmic adaptor subunit [Pseudomonadota bacterium]